MSSNLILSFAESRMSRYLTPVVERAVYGLIYPAVLGASVVEFGLKVRNLAQALPWLIVLILFSLDYMFTASETSEGPARGNIFTALSDLAAAIAFFFAYRVSWAWNGSSHFTAEQLHALVWSVFGLHGAYFFWYVFRLCTKDLATRHMEEPRKRSYTTLLLVNSVEVLAQVIIVGILGVLAVIKDKSCLFFCMMVVSYVGLLFRVIVDYVCGPVARNQ